MCTIVNSLNRHYAMSSSQNNHCDEAAVRWRRMEGLLTVIIIIILLIWTLTQSKLDSKQAVLDSATFVYSHVHRSSRVFTEIACEQQG